MTTFELPSIELRPYQKHAWNALHKGCDEIPFFLAMIVWHRRAGKDLFYLQFMLSRAMEKVGNYWFLLPESLQVRNAIWEGITKDGIKYLDMVPKGITYKIDNQSMKLYLKHPTKEAEGSIISFLGGDRYDKRVGAGLQGAVISESALQKPNLFDLAIEPMLKETGGWCLFNTTPRGNNHAKTMYDYLKSNPKYYTSFLTIADTTDINGNALVPEDSLHEERARGKSEEIIQQEYYCSFEGAIHGSYYGETLRQYQKNVGNYAYDAGYPVHTLWDLGISDCMAIWFIQFVGRDIFIIDFYENSNYGLGHYASVLQGKGYLYAMHHLPHDGNKRELTSAEKAVTVQQQLKNLNVFPIKIHPARSDIYGAIQRTRSFLSRCFFNEETTKDGYESLKQYRREWDENRQVFKNTPYHDWTSHAADAFTILPMIEAVQTRKVKSAPSTPFTGSVRVGVSGGIKRPSRGMDSLRSFR